jgi:hypothetical protein
LNEDQIKNLFNFYTLPNHHVVIKSMLYVALDVGYINEKEFNTFYEQADKISKSLAGFIKYLKTKEDPPKEDFRRKIPER